MQFLGGLGPVVGVIGDANYDFLGRDIIEYLAKVFDKPVLCGDRSGGRSVPVLIVVHEDNGVAFLAEKLVIVGVVAGGKRHHQFQSYGMQSGAELGGEFAEVWLGGVGDFLEVDDYSGLVSADGIVHYVANQILAGGFVAEHGGHFFDTPISSVVIIEQAHEREFDVGRLHPTMEFVVFQESNGLGGAGFDGLVALVVDDGQRAIGSYGMELVGDENVDVFVMLFQGGEAGGVPADEKGGALRVVAGGYGANVGDAAMAAFAGWDFLDFTFEGAIGGPGVWQEAGWELDAHRDGNEKIGQEQSQQDAGDFQHAGGARPADTLRVVE